MDMHIIIVETQALYPTKRYISHALVCFRMCNKKKGKEKNSKHKQAKEFSCRHCSVFLYVWLFPMGILSKLSIIHLVWWTQEPGLQTKNSFTHATADYSYMWSQECRISKLSSESSFLFINSLNFCLKKVIL